VNWRAAARRGKPKREVQGRRSVSVQRLVALCRVELVQNSG